MAALPAEDSLPSIHVIDRIVDRFGNFLVLLP
jgi:hypothetical protein